MRHMIVTHCKCQQQEPVQEHRVFNSSSRLYWFPYLSLIVKTRQKERAEKQNTKVLWEQQQKSFFPPVTFKKLKALSNRNPLWSSPNFIHIIYAKRILKVSHTHAVQSIVETGEQEEHVASSKRKISSGTDSHVYKLLTPVQYRTYCHMNIAFYCTLIFFIHRNWIPDLWITIWLKKRKLGRQQYVPWQWDKKL